MNPVSTFDRPAVSVILPTYQGASVLPALLKALAAQQYPAARELVAVDSGSTDDTLAILRQHGARVITIPHERFTHGYARNCGVQAAQHPLLVFLSQDALPVGEDWLHQLVEPLCDPAIGAVYGRQIAAPIATPLEVYFHVALYPPQSKRYEPLDRSDVPLERIFFSNVCSAIRREWCERFPFDESLIMSEDQAFAKALLQHGISTYYHADAQVIHSHRYDFPTLFRRHFDSAYSLRGITHDSGLHLLRRGLTYIMGEAAYLIAHRQWRWLLALPIYETARSLARILGRYADRLPRRMREAFSLHRDYWRTRR